MQNGFFEFFNTAREVIASILNQKILLLKFLWFPILGFIAIDNYIYFVQYEKEGYSEIEETIFEIVYFCLCVIFAVKTHQIVLLEKKENIKNIFNLWNRQTSIYFLYALFLFGVPILFFIGFALLITSNNDLVKYIYLSAGWFWVFFTAIFLIVFLVLYIFSRFSLVLPSSAISEKLTLSDSWRLTKNYKLYIFCVTFIPVLITLLLSYSLKIYESGLVYVLESLVLILFFVFEVMCLSIAYRNIAFSRNFQ